MDSGSLKYIPEPTNEVFFRDPIIPREVKFRPLVLLILLVLSVLSFLFYLRFLSTPPNFPVDTVVTIPSGESLSGAAGNLKSLGMIRSEFGFKVVSVIIGGTRGLQAGDYYFEEPVSAVTVAWRLSKNIYNLKNIRVTIPEGLTAREIGEVMGKQKNFTHFDKAEFLKLAQPYEGYLFPDTYLFLPNITAQNVVDAMLDNYKKKILELEIDITAFGRPIGEVIAMASILEEEGRTETTRQTIAGILWKRLGERMLLQVDASIVYLTGKKSGNFLTQEDFKIDSPFNSYMYRGLPPTPISNPGLAAIRAAVNPLPTKYYFYLTDPEGGFYPAVTYEEHLANKARYLGY